MTEVFRPAVTKVRASPARLPEHVRRRLAGWARIAIDYCKKIDAPRVGQMMLGLDIALADLDAAELVAADLRGRLRRAEHELAAARKTIIDLQAELARSEFSKNEPTVTREDPVLVSRTLTRRG